MSSKIYLLKVSGLSNIYVEKSTIAPTSVKNPYIYSIIVDAFNVICKAITIFRTTLFDIL